MGDARHRGTANIRLALIGGRRVAYEQYGDAEGRPVLIIHGAWGGPSSTLWNGPRLRWPHSRGLRLIAYDRRCAGLSQYDAEPFSLEDLASDAVGVLDYLDIEHASVIATSAGGPIGLRLALDYPERVRRLVLLNTGAALMSLTPSGVDPHDPFVADRLSTVARRLALLDLWESQGVAAAIAASADEWRQPAVPIQPDPSSERFRANRLRALAHLSTDELRRLVRGALMNMKAQREIDMTDAIRRIQCPTLIMHGDSDTTVPLAYGRSLAAAIPDAEFVVLPGEGHGLIVNQRAQRMVSDWLRMR